MVTLKVNEAVKQICSLCPPTQHFAQCVYQMAALYRGVVAAGSSQSSFKQEYSRPNDWGSAAVTAIWQLSLMCNNCAINKCVIWFSYLSCASRNLCTCYMRISNFSIYVFSLFLNTTAGTSQFPHCGNKKHFLIILIIFLLCFTQHTSNYQMNFCFLNANFKTYHPIILYVWHSDMTSCH